MGTIVLMGSGELTPTMVKVHKALLSGLGSSPRAVFLDTPAGFQLNVDQLSERASAYFDKHIGYPLEVASYKSADVGPYDTEQALHQLRQADYILIGPGSPSYAVRQWSQSPIPAIITERIRQGACLVAASAASLTVGAYTLPVYEIYKVGEELHWLRGLGILGEFGLNCLVVPHWNNAEGGTHDTRFCYMGETRFTRLRELLHEDVSIIGMDEHTACVIDLTNNRVSVTGIGNVTLLTSTGEAVFPTGTSCSLSEFKGDDPTYSASPSSPGSDEQEEESDESFWEEVHQFEKDFEDGLKGQKYNQSANALLGLDQAVWRASQELENDEFISQGREILREMIVRLGSELESLPKSREACLKEIVDTLLEAREHSRKEQRWQEADEIRNWLGEAGIVVEDTGSGPVWKLDRSSQ